jgi:hypothetical protein
MSELSDTLRELDERLVLSRYDGHQWRTVSMAEYALVREYIRKLENQIDVEVMEQLNLREKEYSRDARLFRAYFSMFAKDFIEPRN